MLSFLFPPRWCKPGHGPVAQMKWFELIPSLDSSPIGLSEAARLAKHISHLGLPLKERIRYGQLFFRFLIQCKGPSGRVRLYFSVPDIRLLGFTTAFQMQVSGVYLISVPEPGFTDGQMAITVAAEGFPLYKGVLSIAPFHPEGKDPVSEMIVAMGAGELKAGEEVWLNLSFAPASKCELQRRILKAERWLQSPTNEPVSLKSIWRDMTTDAKARPKHRELTDHQQKMMRSLQLKQGDEEIGLWVGFRVFIRSFSSKARLQTMNDTLQTMRNGNGLFLRPIRSKKTGALLQHGTPTRRLLFTSEELGYWLRIPAFGQPAAEHMQTMHAKIIPAPEGLKEGIFIGKSNVPGVVKEIRMPVNQMLKHTFLAKPEEPNTHSSFAPGVITGMNWLPFLSIRQRSVSSFTRPTLLKATIVSFVK